MLTFLSRNWWVLALRGLAAIVFGILTFVAPMATIAVLVLFWGAYALVDGAFAIFAAFKGPNPDGFPWWVLLMGVVAVLAGVYAFMAPALTAIALVYVIGIFAAIRGVAEIATAIRLRKEIDNEWMLIAAGALSLVFGLFLLLFPGAGALALIVYIGAMAIVIGVVEVMLALRLRAHASARSPQVRGAAR
jgi:uncharacterized membrane protein HdeD (DUF308 family)